MACHPPAASYSIAPTPSSHQPGFLALLPETEKARRRQGHHLAVLRPPEKLQAAAGFREPGPDLAQPVHKRPLLPMGENVVRGIQEILSFTHNNKIVIAINHVAIIRILPTSPPPPSVCKVAIYEESAVHVEIPQNGEPSSPWVVVCEFVSNLVQAPKSILGRLGRTIRRMSD